MREPDLRSSAATAKLLSCSVRTVYRLVERGELRPVRVGRSLRFEIEEIRRFIDTHRLERVALAGDRDGSEATS